jgi:hypothetical protein
MIDAHRQQDFVAPTGLTLGGFVDTWLHALETQGRRVSTLNGYRTTMNRYVLPRLGSRKLQDLRATDLDDLYAELLRSGGVGGRSLSMTSVHHVHTLLGKLLHDAERKGLVVRNVARLAEHGPMTMIESGRSGPTTTREEFHGRLMYPERLHVVALSIDVMTQLLGSIDHFFAAAADEVSEWNDTTDPDLAPSTRQRLERIQTRRHP